MLVHAEVDGEKLEEIDIVMGFFLPMTETPSRGASWSRNQA